MRRVGYAYRPALDGVRALAVVAVIAYHLDPDVLPGGFLGVDVFFVLSGYLIAGLLLAERRAAGAVDLGAFWVRRARRLLPALAAVMVAVAAYARWWAPAETLDRLRADAVATLGYVANWRFALSEQSYFDTQTVASPLRHAWSLAVEEQFYVLFPLLAIACFRTRRPARTLGIVAALGAIASAVAMAVLVDSTDPSFVYYATHTRAQGLLVGVVLACLTNRTEPTGVPWRDRGLQTLGIASLAALLGAIVLVSDSAAAMYRGGYLAAAALVAVVVAAAVRPGPLRAALAIGPLRWIGRRSYGLYLWHWPAIVALEPARTGLEGWQLAGVRLLATIVPAAVSYRFLEAPILHGALPRRRFAWASLAGGTAIVVTIALGTSGAVAPAAALDADPLAATPQVLVAGTSLSAPLTTGRPTTAPATSGATKPTRPSPGTTAPPESSGTSAASPTTDGPADPTSAPTTAPPTTTTDAPWAPRTLAVVGDSVAASALPGFTREAAARGVGLVSFVVPGCGIATATVADNEGGTVPWSKDCAAAVRGGHERLIADHDPDVVLWWSTWEAADRVVGGEIARVGTPEWIADLDAALEARWQALSARGAIIVIVETVPRAASPIAEADRDPDGRHTALRARLDALVARHPARTAVAAARDVLCPSGIPCPRTIDGINPRPNDGGHFTDDTAPWIAARLWPLAEAAWERLGA
jgi:peptidoglycan/LPS O-acetylase OafA/YrhL